jgi:lipopolysaccharide export system protein LptC
MSEAATRERAIKRHWAEPGSRHDKVVRWTKFGLPLLIAALGLLLIVSPFDKHGDTSFILDKNKVDEAQERMRVEAARYTGEDKEGRPFLIVADRAIQQSSNVPVVMIEGMRARLDLSDGPLNIGALRGMYDIDGEKVDINGPVKVVGPDNYSLLARDVTVDLNERTMRSNKPVAGTMKLGDFRAGSMSADLDQRVVRLDGGVRLKITQGAVR